MIFADTMEVEDAEGGKDEASEVEEEKEEKSNENQVNEEHPAVLLESGSNNSPLEVKFETASMSEEALKQSLNLYHFARNGISKCI